MRIISGTARGRTLLCPRGRTVRPTGDRVRESLFSILGDEVREAVVVDLFSGTGALGLEALSRGAAYALFVEKDRGTLKTLERNIEACGFGDRSGVANSPVLPWIARGEFPPGTSLVFADPPYGTGDRLGEEGERTLRALAGRSRDLAGALIVLEYPSRGSVPAPPAGFQMEDRRRYGETVLVFYRALGSEH